MTFLSITQSAEELDKLARQGYYRYLRSAEFCEAFLKPLAALIHSLGVCNVLDVGCNYGTLSRFVSCGYVGFDASPVYVEMAREQYKRQLFTQGRMEDPQLTGEFEAVVFGNLLEVLVKPEERVAFMQMYHERYQAKYLIVYDLVRLDHAPLDKAFKRIHRYYATANISTLIDEKRHRKILGYRCV